MSERPTAFDVIICAAARALIARPCVALRVREESVLDGCHARGLPVTCDASLSDDEIATVMSDGATVVHKIQRKVRSV